MLNVERRYMIKELDRLGWSISGIARETGHDRKTVRKILAQPLQGEKRPREPRVHKLEPYTDYLKQRMEAGVWNAHKLFLEIQERGYPGGETQVRTFVQPLRTAREPRATVRFETQPGQQAQVDWGHFGPIIHQGRRQHLSAFIMTLGWSRMMYVEFTVSMDEARFLRCHQHAFDYFGGVPQEILHDNLKTAVLGRDGAGAILWNPRYLDFALTYGFKPHPCRPYRAQTKGKVENGVKYVRGNFWPGIHFDDLQDLNQQVLIWLDRVANVRIHGTTHEMPRSRLSREGLQTLTQRTPFDTSVIVQRQCSRDCLVSYENNLYSVPSDYAGQCLLVKETEDGYVLVFDAQSVEIARHRLGLSCHERIVDPAHYAKLRERHQRDAAKELWPEPLAGPTVETRPLSVYDEILEVVR
jgi:transposase